MKGAVGGRVKQERSTCPFLDSDAGDGNLCMSQPDEPTSIQPLYVKSFCSSARHFTCRRFVDADPAAKRAAMTQGRNPRQRTSVIDVPPDAPVVPPTGRDRKSRDRDLPPRWAAPSGVTPVLPLLPPPPSIMSPINRTTVRGPRLQLAGRANPHVRVEVFDGPILVGETEANDSYDWVVELDAVPPGTHSYIARVVTDQDIPSRNSPVCIVTVENTVDAPHGTDSPVAQPLPTEEPLASSTSTRPTPSPTEIARADGTTSLDANEIGPPVNGAAVEPATAAPSESSSPVPAPVEDEKSGETMVIEPLTSRPPEAAETAPPSDPASDSVVSTPSSTGSERSDQTIVIQPLPPIPDAAVENATNLSGAETLEQTSAHILPHRTPGEIPSSAPSSLDDPRESTKHGTVSSSDAESDQTIVIPPREPVLPSGGSEVVAPPPALPSTLPDAKSDKIDKPPPTRAGKARQSSLKRATKVPATPADTSLNSTHVADSRARPVSSDQTVVIEPRQIPPTQPEETEPVTPGPGVPPTGGGPQRRGITRHWPLLVALAWVLASLVLVVRYAGSHGSNVHIGVAPPTVVHPATSRPSVAHPTAIKATARPFPPSPTRRATVRPAVLGPARAWTFTPLGPHVDQVTMVFSNPNAAATTVSLQTGSASVAHASWKAAIPARSEIELLLPRELYGKVLSVRARSPVLSVRFVTIHGTSHGTYGKPVSHG